MASSSLSISKPRLDVNDEAGQVSGDYWVSGVVLLMGLAVWEVVGRAIHWLFLPPFSAVISAGWQLMISGRILPDLFESMGSLLWGFGLAVLMGVTLGWFMGRYRKVEYLFDMQLNIMLSSPTLIYVPLLFAFFGVSRQSQTALVFLYAVPVIVANTITAIRLVNPAQVELARSFGANESQLFWKVFLPGALPLVMTGVRTGAARAVKGMIDGEMVIALVGLGASLIHYGGRFEVDKLLAILLVVVMMAIVVSNLVQFAERWASRWLVNFS